MENTKPNQELRQYAKENGVPLYMIAYHVGKSCDWMTRRIRLPMPAEEIEKFKAVIDQIVEQRGAK